MSEQEIRQKIGKTFNEIAEGLLTGNFGKKIKVGLTTLGSEHGTSNLVKGAELASSRSSEFEVVLIGPKTDSNLVNYEANTEEEMYKLMEELLDSKKIDACVTMHYNFPIGVSTVGRVVTPGKGNIMHLATTTGTSSPHRTEAMVLNAISGIVTAKAMGIESPSVGILNLDGARQVERALKQLDDGGYKINFAESIRADGGVVMRGNDLLAGVCDVMVMDTLTGNVMMKVFSSYTTGGDYEALGEGYGPGVGRNMNRVVLILSRASGINVVAGAISYAARLSKINIGEVAKSEFKKAEAAGLDKILDNLKSNQSSNNDSNTDIKPPAKEVVTGQIPGIDILDLEDAVKVLWAEQVYAESGMGCTGPIVMVAESKVEQAMKILQKSGYIAETSNKKTVRIKFTI